MNEPQNMPRAALPGESRAEFWTAIAWQTVPWLIAIVFFFTAEGYLSLGTQVIIWILFTLSLDLALGYAGIITLGHAAFFGFGAYTAGILAVHTSMDPLLAFAIATAAAAVVGFVTGALILHTTGVTLLMLTLAVASMLYEFANRNRWLTGGDDGLQGMNVEPMFGIFEFNIFGETAYVYSLVVLFLWYLVARRLVKSPFGRSLDGIRQNPRRMRSIGTPVWWRLVAIYTISAAMAGSAGALQAHATRFVGLPVLSLLTSGIVAVMLVVGGTRRIYGAFIGATFYYVFSDMASKINPHLSEMIIGILLILVVLFLEGGLMSVFDMARNAWARWRGAEKRL